MTAIAARGVRALSGLFGDLLNLRFRSIDWLLLLIIAIPLGVAGLDALGVVPAESAQADYPGASGFEIVMIKAVSALAWTSIYISIAVFLLAYLKATGAESLVAQAFQGSMHRMIALGALVGGLAPFCSCEVIPFISGLLQLGAPLPAVMAFWLSSPLMDPVQFSITAGVLGWEYAVAKTIAAVSLGAVGGYAMFLFTSVGAFRDPLKISTKKRCGCGPSPFEGKPVWRFWTERDRVDLFTSTAVDQAIFLLRWLSFAYVIEGVLIAYVPADAVATVIGGEGVWPVVTSAFVGMPAYLNGAAAPAMLDGLRELLASTPDGPQLSSGAILTFMLAGAVSSIPAMAAVWSLVKRPVFAAYLGLGLGGAIISGLIFNALV